MAKVGRPREKSISKWGYWKRIQRSGKKASRCANCGKAISGRGAVVDHVDGNQANSSSKNLRTLCRSCHLKKTHKSGEIKVKDNMKARSGSAL